MPGERMSATKGRYSKRWWRGLTKDERRTLVRLMIAPSGSLGGGGYLPDDCSDCGGCGMPTLGTGLCDRCYARFDALHNKADAKMPSRKRVDRGAA